MTEKLSAIHQRAIDMRMTKRELEMTIAWLAGYTPEGMAAALDHRAEVRKDIAAVRRRCRAARAGGAA